MLKKFKGSGLSKPGKALFDGAAVLALIAFRIPAVYELELYVPGGSSPILL